MIQLHRLEGFYRVATTGSFARAARSFSYPLTAPALHQQVRKLEAELGARLLTRSAKDRMSLTAEGRTLHAFCAPFFEQLPAVLDSLVSGQLQRELRIGAAFLEMSHFLPPFIERLRRAHPELRLQIEELHAPDYERLRAAELDLIVDHQPEVPYGIEAQRVGTHHVFLVFPRKRALPAGGKRLMTALAEHDFVSFHPSLSQYALQMAALSRAGVSPRRAASASTAEGILRLVQAGVGYSLVPWPSARGPRLAGVSVRPPPGPAVRFAIHAAFRAGTRGDALVRAALEAFA
jgi:DNA-binding transcriptional LysR family regulator